MRLTIDTRSLESGISTASKAVSQKSPLPILSHVLLRAENDTLRFSATDLEMVIERTVPAEVFRPGACTVPARLFGEIVASLSDPQVTLELDEQRLSITTPTARFRVNTLSADEYPVLPVVEGAQSTTIPATVFRDMAKAILFAVAPPDETRAILTGVLTELDGSRATLTATDGRRLAKTTHAFERALGERYRSVIPCRAMAELIRLSDGVETVEIVPGHNDNFCLFRLGDVVLVARLIGEGKFPDVNAILPHSFSRSMTVGREQWVAAVRRALIMAQEKDTPRLLKLEIQADEMSIRSNTPDLGESCQTVSCHLDGEPINIAFNGRYLLEVLQNVRGDEVQMQMNDPLCMTIMTAPNDADALYMLMPIRVKEAV